MTCPPTAPPRARPRATARAPTLRAPRPSPTTASPSARAEPVPHTLVLLRHGESDVERREPLHRLGRRTPQRQGPRRGRARRRAAAGRRARCPTSCTPRCCAGRSPPRRSALDVADRHWIPVRRSWRLNERHYGALQGKNKKQTLEEYGEEQFMLWRRSFDVPPPPIDDDDEWSQAGLTRGTPTSAPRCPAPSASRTSSPGSCPTGSPTSPPTCAPARPCWSPRTATACARWSSTSTASATRTSPA